MRRTVLFALLLIASFPLSSAAQVYVNARSGGNYMQNYYLPPAASSTPWWPTWAPDGQAIVFAMDGSLWRMRVNNGRADGSAEEILRESTYLSSPEYSPDGRFIAYTADDNAKNINVRILNVATGETTAVTTGDFVSLEPAWSPDGKRLAYVSTAPNGYFNVFVAPIDNGRAGTPIQVTVDHKFGRDRLYFGDTDVHISPSWTPDGQELLLVSNRSIPLGSGGECE